MESVESNEGTMERLARLETSYKAMSRAVEEGFKSIREELHSIVSDINRQRRPNPLLWVAILAVSCTLFTGLYALISLRVDNATSPLTMSLKEVETQMDADAQLRNVEHSQQERLNFILWNATPLGKVTLYPVSPYYPPNVAARNH